MRSGAMMSGGDCFPGQPHEFLRSAVFDVEHPEPYQEQSPITAGHLSLLAMTALSALFPVASIPNLEYARMPWT
jgi:hypothetical protein